MELAASIQAVTEEAVLAMGRTVHQETGMKNLVLAGGVALNCVANGRLLREGPFDDIWIQPAAGDAGGALGAALFAWYQLLDNPRDVTSRARERREPRSVATSVGVGPHATGRKMAADFQRGSLLGPRFTTAEVSKFLDGVGAKYRKAASEDELLSQVVDQLEREKIVGWFQGRMEFGPRALGARSILGDPRSPKMQATMNLKIKFRESFRPFAPIVLKERASDWFEIDPRHESPYMLLVAPVRHEHRVPITDAQRETMKNDPDLRNRVNIPRSGVPAVTHVDYSARLQTVDDERNPRLAGLLRAFDKRTGCPILVNTSFNVRGEPIVCTPQDAYRCFLGTEMDVLVLEDCVLLKDESQKLDEATREKYLAQFQLD
jgi:carbamoyltransferase